MAYVVTESCIACRYGECVEVCPQEAFHEGPNFMVINPARCSNCSLCDMVCPVAAIIPSPRANDDRYPYVELNARLSQEWPVARQTTPLPDADAAAMETNKRDRLILAVGP